MGEPRFLNAPPTPRRKETMSFNLTLSGRKEVVQRSLQLLIVQAQHALSGAQAADNTHIEVNLTGDVSIHPTRGLQTTSQHTVNGLEPDPADLPAQPQQAQGAGQQKPKLVTEA